jgi:hypothetical protein
LVQVTIEYMIMIPVLIMQIFLFPFAAAMIMNAWTDSRQTLQLQEIAGHLGSSMQQLYYSLNHVSIATGSIKSSLDTPAFIDGYSYSITLHNATLAGTSNKIMNITLCLLKTSSVAYTLVTLGSNAVWQNNVPFLSNSTSPAICATAASGTIQLSFIGGT